MVKTLIEEFTAMPCQRGDCAQCKRREAYSAVGTADIPDAPRALYRSGQLLIPPFGPSAPSSPSTIFDHKARLDPIKMVKAGLLSVMDSHWLACTLKVHAGVNLTSAKIY